MPAITKHLPRLRRLLPVLLLPLLVSCAGPSFHRAWKKAANTPSDDVNGRWQGTWSSDTNGHHGRLRCVVTPPETPGGPHQFFYHATWMRVLSGAYKAGHQVQAAGRGRWNFSGEHQMPNWAGGLYRYEGTIENDQFQAKYRCKIDRGTYRLTRVPPEK